MLRLAPRTRLLSAVSSIVLLGSCGVEQSAKAPFHSLRQAVSTSVVISEVYGGGGTTSSRYKYDFVELFNVGSTPVNLGGWSVQYGSTSGTTWLVTALSGTIQPGKYFLVRLGSAGSGTNLPTADDTGTVEMSATAGKVALVNGTTALTGACPTSSRYVDLVGYGTATNCSEGMATANTSASSSVRRAASGCLDTDDNRADFTVGTPTPQNASTAAVNCSQIPTDAGVIPTPDGGCTMIATWPTADVFGGYSMGNTTASGYLDTAPGTNGRVDTLTLEAYFGGMPVLTLPATRTFTTADTYGSCEVCSILERNCDSMGTCTEQYFAQSGSATVTTATQDENTGRFEGTLTNVRFVAWDFMNDEAAPSGACIVLGSATVAAAWPDMAGGTAGGGQAGGASGGAGGGTSGTGGGTGGGNSGTGGGFGSTGGGFTLPTDAGKADGGTTITTGKKPCGCSTGADVVVGQLLAVGLAARLLRRRNRR